MIDLDGSLAREGNLNPVVLLSNRVADVMESLSIPHPSSRALPVDVLKDLEKRCPTEDELKTECPICLKTYVSSDSLIDLPCSHSFHESCLSRWMEIVGEGRKVSFSGEHVSIVSSKYILRVQEWMVCLWQTGITERFSDQIK